MEWKRPSRREAIKKAKKINTHIRAIEKLIEEAQEIHLSEDSVKAAKVGLKELKAEMEKVGVSMDLD